jgi:putative hydrolase of HD superfamily
MWLADAIEEDVDTAEVLRIALLHDLSEAVLTDIPAPAKKHIGAAHIREVESKLTHEMITNMPNSWHRAVDQYFDQTTLESRLVKAADRIQMLAKSCQYRWQNRGNTDRFWTQSQRMEDVPPVVNEIIERLEDHFRSGTWYGREGPTSE